MAYIVVWTDTECSHCCVSLLLVRLVQALRVFVLAGLVAVWINMAVFLELSILFPVHQRKVDLCFRMQLFCTWKADLLLALSLISVD